MEYFFKNFDVSGFVDNANYSLPRKCCLKRRTIEEKLVAIGVLFFILGFGVQYWADNTVSLILLVVLTACTITFTYLKSTDYLLLNASGGLIFYRGFALTRTRIEIDLNDIDFIGIGGREKFTNVGNRHVVYIRHNDRITELRRFVVGREAVVLAKAIRKFVDR